MNDITCPYCSSKRCSTDYELNWIDERFPEYRVAQCKDCDVGFVLPLPSPEELDSLYNSLQYQSKDRATVDFSKASDAEIESKIEAEKRFTLKYQPHIPTEGHVLDIGAGWGTLLKFFANQGFHTTGLELSIPTSAFARDHLGLDIHNIPIEQIGDLPDQKFDLIVMRHTLEHFYDPSAVLQSLHPRLATAGKIIIEVPDYGSFDRRSFGTAWPAFAPYHLWYFTRQSLIRILGDNGYEPLLFHTFLSERVFGKKTPLHKIGRGLIKRAGGKKYFSGRSIGLIAQKS